MQNVMCYTKDSYKAKFGRLPEDDKLGKPTKMNMPPTMQEFDIYRVTEGPSHVWKVMGTETQRTTHRYMLMTGEVRLNSSTAADYMARRREIHANKLKTTGLPSTEALLKTAVTDSGIAGTPQKPLALQDSGERGIDGDDGHGPASGKKSRVSLGADDDEDMGESALADDLTSLRDVIMGFAEDPVAWAAAEKSVFVGHGKSLDKFKNKCVIAKAFQLTVQVDELKEGWRKFHDMVLAADAYKLKNPRKAKEPAFTKAVTELEADSTFKHCIPQDILKAHGDALIKTLFKDGKYNEAAALLDDSRFEGAPLVKTHSNATATARSSDLAGENQHPYPSENH